MSLSYITCTYTTYTSIWWGKRLCTWLSLILSGSLSFIDINTKTYISIKYPFGDDLGWFLVVLAKKSGKMHLQHPPKCACDHPTCYWRQTNLLFGLGSHIRHICIKFCIYASIYIYMYIYMGYGVTYAYIWQIEMCYGVCQPKIGS